MAEAAGPLHPPPPMTEISHRRRRGEAGLLLLLLRCRLLRSRFLCCFLSHDIFLFALVVSANGNQFSSARLNGRAPRPNVNLRRSLSANDCGPHQAGNSREIRSHVRFVMHDRCNRPSEIAATNSPSQKFRGAARQPGPPIFARLRICLNGRAADQKSRTRTRRAPTNRVQDRDSAAPGWLAASRRPR